MEHNSPKSNETFANAQSLAYNYGYFVVKNHFNVQKAPFLAQHCGSVCRFSFVLQGETRFMGCENNAESLPTAHKS